MTKDLIKIIDQNIQYLNSSLGITEAHITWGNRSIKKKYSNIKVNILNKIREQLIDKRTYLAIIKERETMVNVPVIEEEPTEYQFTPQPTTFNIFYNLSLC